MASLFVKHPLAVLLSIIFHIALGASLVFGMDFFKDETIVVPAVNVIKATVIDESKLKAHKEKKRQQEQQRLDEIKKKQDDIKKKKAEVIEAAKQAKLKIEKAQKEKARKKKEAIENERKRKLQKIKDQKDSIRQAQEALALEEAEREIASHVSVIKQKVERNWIQPVGDISGLSCTVNVRMIPSGEVIAVKIIKSSGNALFDRSVEQATRKASPLPLPNKPALMRHFRAINFIFKPGE
jgi:colicin import membrane protein